jgi:hypothetical protein
MTEKTVETLAPEAQPVKALTRDQIYQAQDIERELVQVPEWSGPVYVQGMTGTERDAYEESLRRAATKGQTVNMNQFRAKLVILTARDENGKRLFTKADLEWVSKKSAAALSRVSDVAMRLSGMTKEDAEEMTKNSESDPTDDSGLI